MCRFLLCAFCFLLTASCATYNQSIHEYYEVLQQENYQQAYKKLDHNRLLKKKRNQLLLLLEKGKMAHMIGDYEASNKYLNEADYFFEDARTSAGDVVLGNLLNPMMQTYKGESFEKFLLHYYKALNYLYLGNTQEAQVEARRITLSNYSQDDRSSKYEGDAFGMILQGIIFEKTGDINNAFVAYRNAADLFIKNNSEYYGVRIPDQLKHDVLRTAHLNGFGTELSHYETAFSMRFDPAEKHQGGELILFWENGRAPIKVEENIFFSLLKDGSGGFYFADQNGLFNIPFDHSHSFDHKDAGLADLSMLRLAFPRYEEQPLRYRNASVEIDNQTFKFEEAEDVNTLARQTLRDRFLREAGKALTRMAIKKISEQALKPKQDTSGNKHLQEALYIGLQVFNAASEKADTRHWQSLPREIHYSRVPLRRGTNKVEVRVEGNVYKTLELEGNGNMYIRNICTF